MKKKSIMLLLLLLAVLLAVPAGAAPVLDGFVINDDNPYRFTPELFATCEAEFGWPCNIGLEAQNGVVISGAGIRAVAYQPWDGKVLIGGDFTLTYRSYTLHNLARLKIDGTLDTTFLPEPDAPVHAIAIAADQGNQQESRIYIGGSFTQVTTTAASAGVAAGDNPRKGLARLKAGDGSLDTFDPAKNVASAVKINAIVLQPEKNSVLVGGLFSTLGGATCGNLARIAASGPAEGTVTATFGAGTDGEVHAIALQEGVVVAGGAFTSPRTAPDGNLARFSNDDSFDPAFSAAPDGAVRTLAVQGDGRLVLGGDFSAVKSSRDPGPQQRKYLARVALDGKLDDFDPSPNAAVRSVLVRPEGTILAGGDFTGFGPELTPRNYLAGFNPDGSLDATDPNLNAAVYSIFLQLDKSFLAGGDFSSAGTKHRTRLARFYPNGRVDDDTAFPTEPILPYVWDIRSMAMRPDGTMTAAGSIDNEAGRPTILKLDQNHVRDPSYAQNTNFGGVFSSRPVIQAQLPNGKLIVGGNFSSINGKRQMLVARLDADGNYEEDFQSYFNEDPTWWEGSAVFGLTLQPPGSRMTKDTWVEGTLYPKGTPLEEGMIYVSGWFEKQDESIPMVNLIRVKKNGEIDTSFNPPPFPDDLNVTYDTVWHLFVQPDDKILIVKERDPIVIRLESNGDVDPTFVSPVNDSPPFHDGFWSSYYQRDGQLAVGGQFRQLSWGNGAQVLPLNGFARLNNMQHRREDGSVAVDGSLDLSYNPPPMMNPFNDDWAVPLSMLGQADGKVLVQGIFTGVFDEGEWRLADSILRLGADGSYDHMPNLLSFPTDQMRVPYLMPGFAMQQDGKIVVGMYQTFQNKNVERLGELDRWFVDEIYPLVRFANDTPATQELTVSPEGTSATWLRGGSSPELWSVYFEESATPAGPWRYLGRAKVVPGGWTIEEQAFPRGENRYLRARGYHVNCRTDLNAALFESVRRYYLKPILTITATPTGKSYGGRDDSAPLEFTATGFVDGDTRAIITGSLARESGENVGSYAITRGTLDAGLKYRIDYRGAPFTIDQATLTVTPQGGSKFQGDDDPLSFPYSAEGFVNGDSEALLSGKLGREPGETPGDYLFTRGDLSAGPNYKITVAPRFFTIKPAQTTKTQEIIFNPLRARTYGDADFDPGARATSDLEVSYASSNPAVAQVVGKMIRVVAPGSAAITASQGGDPSYQPAGDVTQPLTVNPPPWHGLGFDGSDDLVRVDNAPQLNFGGQPGFTIESWLRLDGPQQDGTGLLSKGSGAAGTAGYQLLLHGNKIAAEISDATSTFGVAEGLVGRNALNDGLWHHVALSVNRAASSAVLYLDGRIEAQLSDPALGVNPDNAEELRVGVDRSGSHFFKGKIDELRLWKTPRSKTELRSVLSDIIDPAGEGELVAYFHFDEGDAGEANPLFTTAPERTAHRAHGSLQGFELAGSGSNWIASGAFQPLLETTALFSITSERATGGGLVYPNYYPATDRGLCWGTSPNPDLGGECLHAGTGTGPFTGNLTGLEPGVGYHVRAFAVNAMGTAWGNDVPFQTAKLPQTISFDLPAKSYGDPPFVPNGTATSGLTVSYTSTNPEVATVSNGTIRITGAGSAAIIASQGGDSTWTAAPQVMATLTVAKATLTVIADNKSRPYLAPDPAFTVRYQGFVNGDGLGAISGNPQLTTTALPTSPVGSYPIVPSRGSLSAGNYDFAFTNGILTVLIADQEITFNTLRPRTFGDADFDPGATASSGLPVSYASSAPTVAKVVGRKIRVVAPGSAAITASQDGNASFAAAASVTEPLTVNPPPWNALSFDGNDDLLRAADAPQLNFGSRPGFTVEAWLHLDGSQPDGTGLLSKGTPWSPGYQLILHQNRIAAQLSDGSSSVGVAEGLVGTTSLDDGRWHHVALSVDRASSTASLYLDGRLEAELSAPGAGVNPDNARDLLIGVDRSGGRFFRGELDELRLWDEARGREEIRNELSRIIDPANFQHLVAYFHLDEGDAALANASFTTAPERTERGGDGALDGFALSGARSNWVRSGAFLPLLETAPLAVTPSGASGGGLVYPNYYPATDRGLCWGTSANPDLSGSCVHAGRGVGPFTASIGGLAPGTSYYVRAFAVNEMGTAYGNELTLQSAKLEQTISMAGLTASYGDAPIVPGGTATSGLPVSYAAVDPAVAVMDRGRITITGAGSTVIVASQGGNETFNPAPDLPVPLVVAKAPLRVSADNKSRAYRTANPPLTASYSGFVNGESPSVISGEPALSTSASAESEVGDYPIVVGAGTLVAANYRFVPVNGTLTVVKSCQQIVFPPISPLTYGDPPFTVTASACSGLDLTFASSNSAVAAVNGNVVTINGAGSAVITASQRGSGSLDGAPDVSQTVVVNRSGQYLAFPPLAARLLGDPPFSVGATSSSGLPVSYQSSDPTVATVSGNTLTLVGAGTTVITASQEGNANYHAALPAAQPLTVALETVPPLLTVSTLPQGAVTADPVLNVTGSASDASGIASVTVNGVEVTGRASLFSGVVPLNPGENSITVAARDGAGNRSSETLSVSLDAAAPAISLSAPADNSVTNVSLFTASGTVPPGSAVTMAVNGASPQSLAVSGGSFSGTGYLGEGMNTIELAATLEGRSSTIKRSVTLAPGKPFVAVTDPGEDLRTEDESVTVTGVAGSDQGGASVVVEAGGAAFTPHLQGGGFSQQLTLKSGENRIFATVTDSGGNASVAFRNIIKVEKISGDLNADGAVDLGDAAAALKISLGLQSATAEALAHGDVAPLVDGVPRPDGKIDVGDVLVILRKVVGLADF